MGLVGPLLEHAIGPFVRGADAGLRTFGVDEQSGVVRTRQDLDFETQQSYTLVISTRGAPNESPYITTIDVTVLVSLPYLHASVLPSSN